MAAAESFKQQGNEYFAAKRYREAIGFYRQGIDANPDDKQVREALLLNSAAANIALKNYGSALHNARDAMITNPRSLKALFRAGTAFLALDRTTDALGCCELALQFEPGAPDFVALQAKASERAATIARKEAERKERARRKRVEQEAIQVALLVRCCLQSRGLWIADTPADVADIPHVPHFDPEQLPPTSTDAVPLIDPKEPWQAPDPVRTPLIMPVLMLYPQHHESDLIAEYHEDTPLSAHLEVMFPPEARGQLPWDSQGEYVAGRLSVIALTHKGKMLRVAPRLTLRELLDSAAEGVGAERDGIELRGGAVRLHAFPRGSPAERAWIDETKAAVRST